MTTWETTVYMAHDFFMQSSFIAYVGSFHFHYCKQNCDNHLCVDISSHILNYFRQLNFRNQIARAASMHIFKALESYLQNTLQKGHTSFNPIISK